MKKILTWEELKKAVEHNRGEGKKIAPKYTDGQTKEFMDPFALCGLDGKFRLSTTGELPAEVPPTRFDDRRSLLARFDAARMESDRIGSAGLDVYEEESGYFYEDRSGSVVTDEVLGRLISLSNVMVTSHMAFLTSEALANIADTTFDGIAEYQAGKRGAALTNAVLPPPDAAGA